jgi:hypothetical protein
VDAAVPCRWLSRGNKNLRLFNQSGVWQVSDLGSTNGFFLDGARLQLQQPVALTKGETVLEVGKAGQAQAPAWLCFRVGARNAVELSFGMHGEEQTSAHLKWLFFYHEASVRDEPPASFVAANGGADFAADLSFRNRGLWITPTLGSSVTIGGHEFFQTTPLAPGCDLNINGAAWRIEKFQAATAEAQFIPLTATA